MKREGTVTQVSLTVTAGFAAAGIWLLYRSFLGRNLGELGYAYYNYAYQVYWFLILFSVFCVPAAVSGLMSERLAEKQYKNAHRVFAGIGIYVLIAGGIAALAAGFVPQLILPKGGNDAALALRMLAPAILLTGLLGMTRGCFLAYRHPAPIAISQLAEASVALMSAIVCERLLIGRLGSEDTAASKAVFEAAGGAFGIGIGALIGILTLFIVVGLNRRTIYRKTAKDQHRAESAKKIREDILRQLKPLVFSTGFFWMGTYVNQMLFAPVIMEKGFDGAAAAKMFSQYSGMYLPVILFPLVLAEASAAELEPRAGRSFALRRFRDLKQQINDVIQKTMFFMIPAAALLTVLAFPLMRMLFGKNARMASWMLVFGSCAVIFYSISIITGKVLVEIGQSEAVSKHGLAAVLIDAVLLIVLTSAVPLGSFSVMIAQLAAGVFMSIMNQNTLRKCIRYQPEYRGTYVYPGLAAFAMAVSVMIVYRITDYLFRRTAVNLIVAVLLARVLYTLYYKLITNVKEELKKS